MHVCFNVGCEITLSFFLLTVTATDTFDLCFYFKFHRERRSDADV